MEDAQRPDGDFVREHFPNDSDGFLYYLNSWYEFAPFTSGITARFSRQSWANLVPYTTTGGAKKAARYRWNFQLRRAPNLGMDLFANLFSLVDAAGSYGTPNYVANMETMADMENWMRVFAGNHAAANQDCFGCLTGQNLYFYLGTLGTKFSLLMWDFNQVFDFGGAFGPIEPGTHFFTFNSEDPNTSNILSCPVFRRMYWRALQELVNGPLDVNVSGPLLDAKYDAFRANGVDIIGPGVLKTWLNQARSSIAAQIAAEDTNHFTVNASVLVSNDVAYVTGTAPFQIKTVRINGVEWPLTWTTVTRWTTTVPLRPGTNMLSVAGVDMHGLPVPGASTNVAAVYNGPLPSPVGQVVINELMYDPPVPGAEYVELYNTSTNITFDLSGWQLRGLAYTFPAGSLLGPNGFLILAANPTVFAAAYGVSNLVFDTFPGTLQTDGETLTLLQPANNGAADLTIAKVRYGSAPPWPGGANGLGSTLQIIDPRQDNWRVGNWMGGFPPEAATPNATNSVRANLPAFPPLWLNELQADNLTGITNSAGQRTGWVELYNPGTNAVSLSGLYLANNYTNLVAWAFPAEASINPGEFDVIFVDGQTNLSSLAELHTSFSLTRGTGSVVLSRLYNGQAQVLDYVDYVSVSLNRSYGSLPDGQSFERQEFFYPSPGETNNGTSAPLTVAINEWMAGNTHTLSNPLSGKFSDWFELYNYGTNPINLSGYFLTDTLTNRFEFQIPPGYIIPPQGFLLVWADGKSTNGMADLHVTFKMNKDGESLGLFGGDGKTVDYVIYGSQTDDVSQGCYPNGAVSLYFMPAATPGASNVIANRPPLLSPLSNRVVTLGQKLTFLASASDPEQPQQSLAFSLGAGAPPNALITPSNGLFSWIPTNAPSTNSITVVVTDNGTPNLSASQSFTVTALMPPRLTDIRLEGTQLTFTWLAPVSQSYQLEHTRWLVPADWIALGNPLIGTGASLVVTLDICLSAQGFYRLRILP